MRKIEKKIDEKTIKYAPFDLYFSDKKWAVFDIETTGLSPKKSQLILSGFLIPNMDNTAFVKQFFAENLEDEKEIIIETIKVMETLDFCVTYNGRSFDMPFLIKRAKFHNIEIKKLPYNLDIYVLVRKYSDLKNFLPNLKQKTLENFLGLYETRLDTIDGAQSIIEYFDYLESKDENALEKILLHNSDDVCQLHKLLNVLRKIDFHRAMCLEGFIIDNLEIQNLKLQKKQLLISGYQDSINYSEYNDEKYYSCVFNKSECNFTITLTLHAVDNIIFYIKGNNPIILAEDKQVNHRQVCIFIKEFLEELQAKWIT